MDDLSTTQRTLLSAARERRDGSILPLPSTIRPSGGTRKALAALISRGLADERVTSDPNAIYREDAGTRLGIFINETGVGASRTGSPEPQAPVIANDAGGNARKPKKPTKAATVADLLRRDNGATLAELIEATGWLPHTTRAALTGLRKKGHDVQRTKRDGATCYRIEGQA